VVVKLRAESEDITVDTHELLDAKWMSREEISALVTDPAA
jgi:NADH pyrophosphatase NudC (nudix superfamily)|tara:strand:- start:321 stop:440 length:120 start_codon:yes stop_codon:yes gene_type:complete